LLSPAPGDQINNQAYYDSHYDDTGPDTCLEDTGDNFTTGKRNSQQS
jgi:hypothetical protein